MITLNVQTKIPHEKKSLKCESTVRCQREYNLGILRDRRCDTCVDCDLHLASKEAMGEYIRQSTKIIIS